MLLQEGHDAPVHRPPRVPCLAPSRALWRVLGRRRTRGPSVGLRVLGGFLGARWWGAGQIEEALVLLLHLCQQVEQLCLTFVSHLCQLCLTFVEPLCQQCLTRACSVEFALENLDETL
jgi:hypothetical protein